MGAFNSICPNQNQSAAWLKALKPAAYGRYSNVQIWHYYWVSICIYCTEVHLCSCTHIMNANFEMLKVQVNGPLTKSGFTGGRPQGHVKTTKCWWRVAAFTDGRAQGLVKLTKCLWCVATFTERRAQGLVKTTKGRAQGLIKLTKCLWRVAAFTEGRPQGLVKITKCLWSRVAAFTVGRAQGLVKSTNGRAQGLIKLTKCLWRVAAFTKGRAQGLIKLTKFLCCVAAFTEGCPQEPVHPAAAAGGWKRRGGADTDEPDHTHGGDETAAQGPGLFVCLFVSLLNV